MAVTESFDPISYYAVPSRGWQVAVCKSGKVRNRDNPRLVGETVFIGNHAVKCVAVERKLPNIYIQPDELIGIAFLASQVR